MVNSNAKKYEKAEVLLDGDHSCYESANLGGKGSSADLPSFRSADRGESRHGRSVSWL